MLRPSVCVLLLSTLVVMGNALSQTHRQKLEGLVAKVMRCGQIPALGVALVNLEDRYPDYVKAFGTESVSSRDRATVDTKFCLGGATEAFTATMLARLIHDNENVTWSTPLYKILGFRTVLSERYRTMNLNLMDIFAQRSGYPNMDIVSVVKPYSSDRLTRYLRYLQPVAGFREKYVPNQVLFSVLESVIKKLSDDSWETLMKDLVLRPLKMNSVMFLGGKTYSKVSSVAYPVYFMDNKPYSMNLESFRGLTLIKQASSLCLSPRDMAKWMRFLMTGKDAEGKHLVDMAVLEEIFQGIQSRGYSDDPVISGYKQPEVQVSYAREQNSLGFITGHYRGYNFVSQDGSLPGAQTLVTVLPDRKVAVFASFTGKGGSQGQAAKTLINLFGLDLMMGGNTWFDESNVCTILNQMKGMHASDSTNKHADVFRTTQHPGSRPLDDFVGYYRNYAYGDVLVKFNATEDQALLMEYGNALYRMDPTNQNNTFQLFAKGPLWHTTASDSTKGNRIIAVFEEDPRDTEQRIRDLVISGFDKETDIVYSVNPTPPRFEGFYTECPDNASTVTPMSILITSLLASTAAFFR